MDLIYCECHGNALQAVRAYVDRFPKRRVPSNRTFVRIHLKIRVAGSFNGQQRNAGRGNVIGVQQEQEDLNFFEVDPGRSVRETFKMSLPTTLAVYRELAARLEQDELVSNVTSSRTCSPSRKSYMLSTRGDRSRSEQGPHPIAVAQHLWGGAKKTKKRTSAPQMGASNAGGMRTALILRSRRSWPVAPVTQHR
ncbi:uncharacterized protein [Euwallacea fornicatus]|uniref:uncharacterized protein isoform X2 n=1 Tax=Euwallacea fornicatus TaxID=995702 RepID=UPI00338FB8B9